MFNKITYFILTLVCLNLMFVSYKVVEMDERIHSFELPDTNVSDGPLTYREVLPAGFAEEVLCLQKNIYFEARNQTDEAKIAVAWVTINRVHSSRYSNTVCEVVHKGVHRNGVPLRNKCQFSWYCDGIPDTPSNNKIEQQAWKEAGELAEYMALHCLYGIDGKCPPDITNGALFYHNPKTSDPSWRHSKVKTAAIDDHDFYTYNKNVN